jgi:hypothetical protein
MLFEQGNRFFEQHEYAKAVELYTQALAEWDHPQIHFNLTVALVSLDRILEAYEHVQAALKFGAAGLDNDKFHKAQTYQQLLQQRLVAFEAETEQDGVQITFDGKLLLSGKGKAALTTLPGIHALVATKDGFETLTKNLVLVGGQPATESIVLKPRIRAVRNVVLRRRFRAWIPWTITGAGAGSALIGAGLIVLGHSQLNQFQAELAQMFPNGATTGEVPASLWNLRTRARVDNGIGLGLVTAGGAAMITGLVMVALNQPHEVEMPPPVVVSAGAHDLSIAWLGRF